VKRQSLESAVSLSRLYPGLFIFKSVHSESSH
jgi:hypothetical protein